MRVKSSILRLRVGHVTYEKEEEISETMNADCCQYFTVEKDFVEPETDARFTLMEDQNDVLKMMKALVVRKPMT